MQRDPYACPRRPILRDDSSGEFCQFIRDDDPGVSDLKATGNVELLLQEVNPIGTNRFNVVGISLKESVEFNCAFRYAGHRERRGRFGWREELRNTLMQLNRDINF